MFSLRVVKKNILFILIFLLLEIHLYLFLKSISGNFIKLQKHLI